MTRRPYFVILGAMRTGSNLLEKSLGALGDTRCFGEAFNPAFMGEPRFETLVGWTKADRDADPNGFLDAMIDAEDGCISGFRLFDGHNEQILERVLKDPDCRRIILRRDAVESYVSLKIARQTGQWLLNDPSRRMRMKVAFDGAEFDAYRQKLDAHYQAIDQQMADAATDAYRVEYADLSDQETMWALARFIGSNGQVPPEPPILRQNPSPMSEKVSNYPEMCAWLGVAPQSTEQGRLVGAADMLVPEAIPILYAPIAGPGFIASISMIQRLGQQSFGIDQQPYGQTMALADQGALYPSGFATDDLADMARERCAFTIVCHPLERLHRQFLAEIFGRSWRFSTMRRALAAESGDLPDPRKRGEDADPFGPETHRALFKRYLELVAQARSGEGALVLNPAWCPQSRLIDEYQDDITFDGVLQLEQLPALATLFAEKLGLDALPAAHARVSLARAKTARFPMDDVLTPDIVEMARALDADCYEAFGYDDLPPDPG